MKNDHNKFIAVNFLCKIIYEAKIPFEDLLFWNLFIFRIFWMNFGWRNDQKWSTTLQLMTILFWNYLWFQNSDQNSHILKFNFELSKSTHVNNLTKLKL
jgi:hypothetical protein